MNFQLNNNDFSTVRQRVKRFVVLLAVWGLVPIPWAEWVLSKWGLAHE